MKTLLFLAFLLTSVLSSAQHPSYYKFAEEQFKGVNIYDVIQDNELNYWFATDQGLVVHDGYSYDKTSCPEMKGLSVFGFVKDEEGTIYCYNLHQQIFRIEEGRLELYFEIPENLVHHELNLLIDHDNHLLIQSNGIIRIAPNKKSIEIIERIFEYGSPVNFHLMPDGSAVSASNKTIFAQYKDGEITYHNAKNKNGISADLPNPPFSWVTMDNRVYAVDHKDLDVFEVNQSDFTFTYITTLKRKFTDQVIRLHATKNQVYISGIGSGTVVYSSDFKPLFDEKIIYPSVFISNFFTDAEGNLLLSTFDEGVMVIPNFEIQGFALPNNEKIIHVESDGQSSLFISSDIGNIYHFSNGNLRLLYSDPAKKSNEGMKYWAEQKMLVFYSSKSAQFRSWDGQNLIYLDESLGAFKHGHFESPTSGLIAFNYGICSVQKNIDGPLKFHLIADLQKRAYCVVRDENNQSIYAALSNGLVRRSASGALKHVQYKGRTVYPNSLLYADGKIYVGTRKHGILVYEDDQLIQQIPFNDVIKKMDVYNSQLFVLSNRGLDISRLEGKNMRRLNNASGLSFEYISEFHISNNRLYITDSKSLQFISLDKLFRKPVTIPVHFNWVKVNNVLTKKNGFSYDQRKIEFSFGVSTLQFRDNVQYRYKLEGYDKEWQLNSYANNAVTYNALSPGKYTFIVRALNDSAESESVSYSFSIDAPFHQKWWFYLLIFVVTGLLITLFFFYRIRNIRKKNSVRLEKQKTQTDLLEFELKALRSQMNPHFIFNSLNSIQDLILKEETDASYDYIVLFADLVRSTLNHSNKDFIEIDKELEFIKVYLSLEHLRFKEDFEYTIESNGILDIKLPTLLIQPFIENALVHGLIHKEGLKRLWIEFNLTDGLLTCSIRDNGIGRAKAKEIKERQGSHESFALNAIEKRLAILNQNKEYACGFVFHDLMENGEPSGTEVIVTLPYKQLY